MLECGDVSGTTYEAKPFLGLCPTGDMVHDKNRREFTKGCAASASAMALQQAIGQRHEPTGDIGLDERQREIDAVTPGRDPSEACGDSTPEGDGTCEGPLSLGTS